MNPRPSAYRVTAAPLLILCSVMLCACAGVDDPDTLFLTWHHDPTSSMVVQWLDPGEPLPPADGVENDAAYHIPRLAGITVDGQTDDWADDGFKVLFMADYNGKAPAPDDLQASFRLGWNQRGLLVLVEAIDDGAMEKTATPDAPEVLEEADSIQLFVADQVGSLQRYRVILAPRGDHRNPDLSQALLDYRTDKSAGALDMQAASVPHDHGYTVEILLPWANLGRRSRIGQEIGFQLYVFDRDNDREGMRKIVWYPARNTDELHDAMHTLRLSAQPGAAVRGRADARMDGDGNVVVEVFTDLRYLDGQVEVSAGDRKLVSGRLGRHPEEDVAWSRLVLPAPPAGRSWASLHVAIDGQPICPVNTFPGLWSRAPNPMRLILRDDAGRWVADVTTTVQRFGPSPIYAHRAEFTGLTLDSRYYFTIGSYGAAKHSFRTAPGELTRPITFAEGGDIGAKPVVADLHRHAAAWDPLFGFVGGDLAYADGKHERHWVAYLKLWRRHMVAPDGRLIPMVVAIGNHEVDGGFEKSRDQAPFFYQLFGGLFTNHGAYAALDFGNYMSLVMLDSDHTAPIQGAQTEWLVSALETRRDRQHLFVAYHVPAYPSHRPFDDEHIAAVRQYWPPIFEKYGIPVVFEHHDHAYKRTNKLRGGGTSPNGVTYIGDGAWGKGPRTVEQRPYLDRALQSLNVIRVTLDHANKQFVVVDEDDEVIDKFNIGSDHQ